MNQILQKPLALLLLIFSLPLYPFLFLAIKLSSKGPFIFSQNRMGKNRKPFRIYKFRTMHQNAEKIKFKYAKLNQSDGPTFKIYNDPRFTPIGRLLAHSALDELPQLFNIIKGDMAFVGPRPLPIEEANKVPKKYELRFSILPGLTSPWVIKGAHKLTFDTWMRLDIEYVSHKNIWYDSKIILLTGVFIIKSWFSIHV